MNAYNTVFHFGRAETEVKKSRFIGLAWPITSEEEAEKIIAGYRKEFWDASHCVYAYRTGGPHASERSSDDGEPAHTAGVPVLSYLQKEELVGVLAVVIRYFGGTLLGTGGLVRAYSEAAKLAVEAAEKIRVAPYVRYRLEMSYERLGRMQYRLAEAGHAVLSTDYGEQIRMKVLVAAEDAGRFLKMTAEASDGQVIPQEEAQVMAAEAADGWHFF